MRELYAVELHGSAGSSNNALAWEKAFDWAKRHCGGDDPAPGAQMSEDVASDGQRVLVLTQLDATATHRWRSEVALGPPDAPLDATVRIRIGATPGSAVAPFDYDFGSPTIVRTLLREFEVMDTDQRVAPAYIELGASDVPALAAWLQAPSRRLPVVVISRTPATGEVLVDPSVLARELAGVAHVRVLASSHAAWGLTEVISRELSVWDGAVRVYFPGFALGDAWKRHRIWFPDHVDARLIRQLRSWLGTLASARIAEHPVHERLRLDRQERLSQASQASDVQFLTAYAEELERANEELKEGMAELQSRNAELEDESQDIKSQLEAVQGNFAEVAETMGRRSRDLREPEGPLTVQTAMDAVELLASNRFYRDRVTLADAAIDSGRRFDRYSSPDELLRAVQAVLEAGALQHDGKLGMTPKDFFNARGFGYGAQPSPHLKVDEATSPDQCLRIYWTSEDGRWVITHIGSHL